MFSGGIGLPEVLLVLAIVLIIFGPKRLPQLGRSLGSGMRNFKESVSGRHKDDDDDDDHPELTAAKTDDRPAGERPANEPVGRSGE
jgi:sec-independent protein translocase protein TatA